MPKFEVIEDNEPNEPAPAIPAHTLDTILDGLKALPRKTAEVFAKCFALLTVATVFCLSLMIIPYQPSAYQLVGLGGYCLFIIALNMITRR